jgi:creatinine amidohydrolase
MTDHAGPWRLKNLLPSEAASRLRACPMMLIPVGGTAVQSPSLPLGTDTLLVERIADDVSTQRGLVRAPALEYGVHERRRALFGGVALRRKTLHRVINEVIDSWETGGGVRHFVLLTALANEAHLEALSTVRVEEATVTTIDIFSLDFATRLKSWTQAERLGELVTSLMLYLYPTLVHAEAPDGTPVASVEIFTEGAAHASPETGRTVYEFMLERILHVVDAVLAGR